MYEYKFEYPSSSLSFEVYGSAWFPDLKVPIESDFFGVFGTPKKIWSNGSPVPIYTPSMVWDSLLFSRGIRYEGAFSGQVYRIYIWCYSAVDEATLDKYFTNWSWL